jgi:hypothetical protein
MRRERTTTRSGLHAEKPKAVADDLYTAVLLAALFSFIIGFVAAEEVGAQALYDLTDIPVQAAQQ